METLSLALGLQIALLIYHQLTTFLDLFPFNGARFYARKERIVEMGVNFVLMSLAIVGGIFSIRGLQIYALLYYPILFAIELIIWWLPYLWEPAGTARHLYNALLALGTSDFAAGDTLGRWKNIYQRIHANTLTILPKTPGRITPNLEHTILHALTLACAIATYRAYIQS